MGVLSVGGVSDGGRIGARALIGGHGGVHVHLWWDTALKDDSVRGQREEDERSKWCKDLNAG